MTTPQATAPTPVSHRAHVIMAIASLAAGMLTLTGCQPKDVSATYTIINNTNQELYISGLGLNHVASIPAHSQGVVNLHYLGSPCTIPRVIDTTWTYLREGPKICDGDTLTIAAPPTEPADYSETHVGSLGERPRVCNITTGCPTPASTRPPSTTG